MAQAEAITSVRNPLLKEVAKASAKGGLTESGLCLAEGLHLLEEALSSGMAVDTVLTAESMRAVVGRKVEGLKRVRVAVVKDDWFQRLSTTESTQGVMALVRPPAWGFDNVFRGRALVVVMDGVQDPGNAGAIVRSAEAFGATGVMFLKGTANAWHPKTLRASAGSLFRVPVMAGIDAEVAVAAFAQRRAALLAAVAHGGRLAHETDLRRACGIVIGSEGRGVSAAIAEASEGVRIATSGVESLNASVAASVLLYEASAQRRLGTRK